MEGAAESGYRQAMGELRVVIADDEEMVRSGLRMVVDAQPDLTVVGEAADGREVTETVRRTKPDVVLMDIRMPHVDGVQATRAVLSATPAPRVVMLTTFDDDATLYEALRAGASGFLLKASPPEQLLDGIRAVGSGQALIDPQVTRRVLESFAGQPSPAVRPSELDELTAREEEVLRLLARGLSNREIAAELIISEATAKTHVVRVLGKLGVRDRAQAVVFAYESGVVRPGSPDPDGVGAESA
jgi:DNA-binding NarL/FixJ family response regulator